MDEQGEYIKDFQKGGMDTPDHYIDLDKCEAVYQVDDEIKKLRQDIEIRRNVRQKMGEHGDDEKILIIEEKIKLLEDKRVKLRADQKVVRGWVYFFLFVFFGIPILILAPVLWVVPVLIISIMIARAVRRKKKAAKTIDGVEPEVNEQSAGTTSNDE